MRPSRRHCLSAALLLSAAAPGSAQIRAVSLLSGEPEMVHVCAPPGDTARLFVVNRLGSIRILRGGVLEPAPFLDITPEVLSGNLEQGLLGLVFHPQYATNGYFYVNFTTGTGNGKSIVRRYTVSSNPDSADENSGHQILELVQPGVNHNAGALSFDSDGMFWVAFGDGGGDPFEAQDLLDRRGKMLRIDVDVDDFPADTLNNYAVPPDNPYVGNPAALDEIWASGLRNPWRWSFDSLTGDLYIGDVGNMAWEEIDVEAVPGSGGGLNYGWPWMEADSCWRPPVDCQDSAGIALTTPVYAYPNPGCAAVVGGYVYRGSALPSWLYGHYFFADYCVPGVWSFRLVNGQVMELTDWSGALGLGTAIKFPGSFWQDEQGELYLIEFRANPVGDIWKLEPDSTALDALPEPVRNGFALRPPRPNPTAGEIRFDVLMPSAAPLDVGVFDTQGRLVRRLHSGAGRAPEMLFRWDGRAGDGARAASGVYFLRVKSGANVATKRVALRR